MTKRPKSIRVMKKISEKDKRKKGRGRRTAAGLSILLCGCMVSAQFIKEDQIDSQMLKESVTVYLEENASGQTETVQTQQLDQETVVTLQDADFSDFSIWKSGDYNYKTGAYVANPGRICTEQLFLLEDVDYTVTIHNLTNTNEKTYYKLVVREYDENMTYLGEANSFILSDQNMYHKSENAVYLRCVCYRSSDDGFSYAKWKNAFADGFYIDFTTSQDQEEVTEETKETKETTSSSTDNVSDYQPQKSQKTLADTEYLNSYENIIKGGCYYSWGGAFTQANNCYCYKDLLQVSDQTYYFYTNDDRISVSLHEYDKDGKWIKYRGNIANGDTYTPSQETVAYVTLNLSSSEWGKDVAYLFENGVNLAFSTAWEDKTIGTVPFSESFFEDYANWSPGTFLTKTNSFGVNTNYICIPYYQEISDYSRTYMFHCEVNTMNLTIYEFDAKKTLLKKTILTPGMKWTPSEDCKWIITTLGSAERFTIKDYEAYFETEKRTFSLSEYIRYKHNTSMKDLTAYECVDAMNAGWNLGNSLDSKLNSMDGKENLSLETYYGNVVVTKELIDYVHSYGFNTIRIPVTWCDHTYQDENGHYRISEKWLERVSEVVDYALENNMYVIINSHHDGELIYTGCSDTEFEKVLSNAEDLWSDIAEYFQDYDEHLIFESYNEVDNVESSWQYSDKAAAQMNRLNQVFVDAIRDSGGNNAKRVLCVGTLLNGDGTSFLNAFTMPTDTVEGKIMVQVHDYDQSYTQMIEPLFERLDAFSKKIDAPVIIGEWGSKKSYSPAVFRVHHASNFVARAKNHGIKTIVWDNSSMGDYGLVDRRNFENSFSQILSAIVRCNAYADYNITQYSQKEYFIYQTLNQLTGKLTEDPYWGTIVTDVDGHGIEIPEKADYLNWSITAQNTASGYECHYVHFYDENMNCLEHYNSSHNAPYTIEIPEGAKYVRMGINSDRQKTTKDSYESMLESGDLVLYVSFQTASEDALVLDPLTQKIPYLIPGEQSNIPTTEVAEKINYTDINNWESGRYDPDGGEFMESSRYITIKQKVSANAKVYEAVFMDTDSRARLLVCEYDEEERFITSTVLSAKSNTFEPKRNTKSLTVTYYYYVWGSLDYSYYEKKMEENKGVDFIVVEEKTQADTAPLTMDTLDITQKSVWIPGKPTENLTLDYEANGIQICEPVKLSGQIKIKCSFPEYYQLEITEFDANQQKIKTSKLLSGVAFQSNEKTACITIAFCKRYGNQTVYKNAIEEAVKIVIE